MCIIGKQEATDSFSLYLYHRPVSLKKKKRRGLFQPPGRGIQGALQFFAVLGKGPSTQKYEQSSDFTGGSGRVVCLLRFLPLPGCGSVREFFFRAEVRAQGFLVGRPPLPPFEEKTAAEYQQLF